MRRKKVLVLCHDTIGAKMAGPGIRYQNLADQIKRVAEVDLAVYADRTSTSTNSDILSVPKAGDSYKQIFDKYDVIFAQWLSGDMLAYAKAIGKVVIIDLYAPVPIEYLASLGFSSAEITAEKDLEFAGILETYKQYLSMGDFFVCSNERQRDFWIGFITASNQLHPTNFRQKLRMENIALCPMGISSTPPRVKSLELREKAGLKKDDFVMLWTGGIWDWFDAAVVIEAVKCLNNPKVKLVFMGTKHPNSEIVEMSESKSARSLSDKLGLTDNSVFFLDDWVPYEERAAYLKDADVAIYADKDSVETRFSHRTRVLDHIWAGLPTICSQGDYLSEVLNEKGMGIVVGERTSEAFAEAIVKAMKDPKLLNKIRANIARYQKSFTWEEQSKDLLAFIKNCELSNVTVQSISDSKPARPTPRHKKAVRRMKNSVKVLLGRIDV